MVDQPEVALTGRAPTTPCDFYVVKEFASGVEGYAGNFELVPKGTLGSVGYAIKAKVTLDSTKRIWGLVSAGSFEVETQGSYDPSSWGVVELRSHNDSLAGTQSQYQCYIMLREKGTNKMTNLFTFLDAATAANSATALFSSDATGATANTHAIRFMVKAVPYWIMVTNAPPSGS